MPNSGITENERFYGLFGLWRDLRSGRAGFGVRIVLSVASAGLCVAAMMLMLGLLENNRVSIREEETLAGLAIAAGGWMACLYALWSSFPRWRRALRTGFVCIGIIVTTIGVCIFFGTLLRRPEFFIAGTIFGGIASVLIVLAAVVYQSAKGRRITDSAGAVQVICPGCGYSMAGLDACACPECGGRYTLDELIRLQGYEALANNPAVILAETPAPAAADAHQLLSPRRPLLGPSPT